MKKELDFKRVTLLNQKGNGTVIKYSNVHVFLNNTTS